MDLRPLVWLCLLVAASTTACSRSGTASSGPARAAEPVPAVAVARVQPESFTQTIVLTGEFRPYQSVDLHAKIAGYLKSITVDVGDRVAAGQLIAVLDVPEMGDDLAKNAAERQRRHAELLRAKSELERAEADRALVEISYSRLASVNKAEPGLIAQQELDELLARKRVAEAQVAAAKAALAACEQQIEIARAEEQRTRTLLQYSRVTAPFAGLITKRFADPGAMIQAGTASQTQAMPLVRLAQIDRLRLVVPVPESQVAKIRIGAGVLVRVKSLGKTFRGTVSRSTGDLQLSTRTMDLEVDVPNAGGELVPGMYADAMITLQKREATLGIPVQALITRNGKRSVMVVSGDGIIEERAIETGLETAERIEALSGLQAGEEVIISNKSQLTAGQKVEAKLSKAS